MGVFDDQGWWTTEVARPKTDIFSHRGRVARLASPDGGLWNLSRIPGGAPPAPRSAPSSGACHPFGPSRVEPLPSAGSKALLDPATGSRGTVNRAPKAPLVYHSGIQRRPNADSLGSFVYPHFQRNQRQDPEKHPWNASTEYGEEGSAKNALRIAAITGVLAAPSAILLVPGLGSIYLALCVFAGVLIVRTAATAPEIALERAWCRPLARNPSVGLYLGFDREFRTHRLQRFRLQSPGAAADTACDSGSLCPALVGQTDNSGRSRRNRTERGNLWGLCHRLLHS
jgi:hypothetical protein